MDKVITATEANRDFSELLRKVEHGETVAVTRRGRVVARIVPSAAPEEDARKTRAAAMQALVERLAQRPVRNLGKITRDDGYD